MADSCEHLDALTSETIIAKSSIIKFECSECIKLKDAFWVQLRLCQTCGKLFCCESSPNQHAKNHYLKSGHSVFTSAELGDNWAWCYEDEILRDPAI